MLASTRSSGKANSPWLSAAASRLIVAAQEAERESQNRPFVRSAAAQMLEVGGWDFAAIRDAAPHGRLPAERTFRSAGAHANE
ncbi:MAG: hypothetical protein ABW128_22225 [Rhizorhabdus sp.]